MRYLFLSCCFALIFSWCVVPASGAGKSESYDEALPDEVAALASHQQAANVILATWGVGSVTLGAIQLFSPNPFVKAFGLQNLVWGGIDGSIAIFGHTQLQKLDWSSTTALEENLKFRRILLINALLDVLYLAIGYLLWRKANVKWRGHGAGIMLQGGFLFVFDWVNYGLTF